VSNRTLNITDALYDYILDVSLREPEILAELREETSNHTMSMMQISPEQGQFMSLLGELTGAKRYLEVGTFTGYSSLAMALSIGDAAEIVCCDVSEEYTDIAQKYWQRAGVAEQCTLHLGHATETLEMLIKSGHGNYFDMMFIDADKTNYGAYYDVGLQLVRSGGLIAIDNVLWDGQVVDPAVEDEDTEAIRAINARLHHDERISLSLVPIGDGLTLIRKK
jgi:predicted O-methyltransferase YrrM